MSRRSHIKRAKILRGWGRGVWSSSAVSFRSGKGTKRYPNKYCRRSTRKCNAMAQAMRGYYHE